MVLHTLCVHRLSSLIGVAAWIVPVVLVGGVESVQ